MLIRAHIAVRIEYLRARSRALRFREQINMLIEEKRRVLVGLEVEAVVWDRRELDGMTGGTTEGQGRAAYAAKQAAVRRDLAKSFAALWKKAPTAAAGQEEELVKNVNTPLIIDSDESEESSDDESDDGLHGEGDNDGNE